MAKQTREEFAAGTEEYREFVEGSQWDEEQLKALAEIAAKCGTEG